MNETWLTLAEHHISFAAIMGIVALIAKEYKVHSRIKERINELWFNYCGERQKLYSPVENGSSPVVPPRPTQQ